MSAFFGPIPCLQQQAGSVPRCLSCRSSQLPLVLEERTAVFPKRSDQLLLVQEVRSDVMVLEVRSAVMVVKVRSAVMILEVRSAVMVLEVRSAIIVPRGQISYCWF